MKGGYRPGGGRPKGALDKKPRKKYPISRAKLDLEAAQLLESQRIAQVEADQAAQVEQIHSLLTIGQQAKRKFVHDYLFRVANKDGQQKPLSVTEMRHMNQLNAELEEAAEKLKSPSTPELSSLEAGAYLYRVWNDPTIDLSLRIRAAEIVIRIDGEKKGKKDLEMEKAVEALKGKFAAGRSPLALVK